MRSSRGAYPGLMALVLASSRSMPDFDAAARGFAFVPIEVLKEKRRCCPAEIPFDTLGSFVLAKAAEAAAFGAPEAAALGAPEEARPLLGPQA